MKSIKLFSAFCALLAFLFSGCEFPEGGSIELSRPSDGVLLKLQIEDPSTKINTADASGICGWYNGDKTSVKEEIAVYVENGGNGSYKDAAVSDISGTNNSVGNISLSVADSEKRTRFAVYPASAAVAAHPGSSSDPLQVRYAASYDFRSLDATELREFSRIPMVANNDHLKNSTMLNFVHIGGLLRVRMSNVPAGTNSVDVEFLGMEHVTGTYPVKNLLLEQETTSRSAETGAVLDGSGNTVHFDVKATVAAGDLVVNVPLPAGDYGKLTGIRLTVSGGVQKTAVRRAAWPSIARSQGKTLDCDFEAGIGEVQHLEIGATDAVTLWQGGTTDARTSQAYDGNGNAVSGAVVSWSSSDDDIATVDSSTGAVTAGGTAGKVTITATVAGTNPVVQASYTVYVNTISISLNKTSLTGRVDKTAAVKAIVTHTRNGDWRTPEVSWNITDERDKNDLPASGVVKEVVTGTTISGEAKEIEFKLLGSAKLTAKLPDECGGASATCNIDILNSAYIPGKFSVDDDEQVYFASGNLIVENTRTSGVNVREWRFGNPQWEFYYNVNDAPNSLNNNTVYSVEGETYEICHFGWATAGVSRGTSPYSQSFNIGSDMYHYRIYPHYTMITPTDPRADGSTIGRNYNHYAYGPSYSKPGTVSGNGKWGYAANVEPYPNDGLLPTGIVKENSWNTLSVDGLDISHIHNTCEWGVHFDDEGTGHDNKRDGEWFTLSAYQWNYLLTKRKNAYLLHGLATIFDVVDGTAHQGLVLLPDNWETPDNCTKLVPMETDYGLNLFIYNGAPDEENRWEDMENAGAVFLPAAFSRRSWNTSYPLFEYAYNDGYYWTSSCYNEVAAYALVFHSQSLSHVGVVANDSGSLTSSENTLRIWGGSVRLVHH